ACAPRGRRGEAAAEAAAGAGQAGRDSWARPRGGASGGRGAATSRAGRMILVYIEHQDGQPDEASLQAIALARGIAGGDPVEALVAGSGAAEATATLGSHGSTRMHLAEHDSLASYAPIALGRCIAELIERLSPAAVIAAGSERGNEVMAHAAAITELPLAANCIAAEPGDPLTVTRVRWGGS